jgi:GTP cyclohydrolase I
MSDAALASPERSSAHLRAEEELARCAPPSASATGWSAAGCRYHANDNIADFIADGELEALQGRGAGSKLQGVLRALVIDTDSDHNTQRDRQARGQDVRATRCSRGRYQPHAAGHRVPQRRAPERADDRRARSPCAAPARHHLCPIMGQVWIGLLPNEHSNLIGLSKYARLADWVMSRPQIQEEAVTMLANELQEQRAARRPGHRDGGRPLLHGTGAA